MRHKPASASQHGPDLTACDHEPIRIPGSIQPHGVLLAINETKGTIVQASANIANILSLPLETIIGAPFKSLLPAEGNFLTDALASSPLDTTPTYIGVAELANAPYLVLAHRHDGVIIVEMERATAAPTLTTQRFYPVAREFISQLQSARTVEELARLSATEVSRLTGFGRVLVYRFDAEWNGQVIAECRNDHDFPSLTDHHFPATDIPAQARELYRTNTLRLIADAAYTPVPIVPAENPVTGLPLDLSYAVLRSVSPVHVEYMKNMRTGASMSVSILVEGRLWGLIACHNRDARHVPFETRMACDFIGQLLSLQIGAREHMTDYEYRIALKSVHADLLNLMATEQDFIATLERHGPQLMKLTGAAGVALLYAGQYHAIGDTPPEKAVRALANRLSETDRDVYHTNRLSDEWEGGENIKDTASGVLAVAISKLYKSFIIWFRPEVLRTIRWGGKPQKPVTFSGRIHPRKSFDTWQETVRLTALPWRPAEIDAAAEFRNAVVGIILRRAEELAALSEELARSNQELEAFSHSVSHDLRAPFRHIVGYSELIRELDGARLSDKTRHYLENVIESGQFAGQLVDNLLHFSQVGRLEMEPVRIDLNRLVKHVQKEVLKDADGRAITWNIARLPSVMGDPLLLRLVFVNLLSNAVKYTKPRNTAVIDVGYEKNDVEYVFFIRDNGVGFEMQYVDKLFGVFQRLHRMEDFEGTGIGLANVRRIVARHGGRTWAEGEPDKGATFYFSLPIKRKEA